jgi:multiple sugar transport system substrate-binding protein
VIELRHHPEDRTSRVGSRRLGLALAGLLALAGCGKPQDGEVTLEFWAMGREGEVVQALTREFERQNPGIRVRVQQIPWSAAHEKLLTAYAGDTMPDVFQLGTTWVPEFVALDALAPLDGRVAASRETAPADFFQGIVDSNQVDGHLWGLPWYVDTRLLFYRQDILSRAGHPEPPRTWQEWRDAMAAVKRLVGADADAIVLPSNEWAPLVILALEQDADLLKGDAECGNFDGQGFRKALAFYLAMFKDGFASARTGAEIENLYQEFASGRFAMYLSGPWNLGEFASRMPAALKDAWATAPMPSPDRRYPGVSLAGGASLAIRRTSPHQVAAWKLIEFLGGTAQQIRFYQLSGNLPARTAAWADPALAGDRRARAFFEQLQQVRSPPKIPEWERITAVITRRVDQLVRGDRTLDATVAALDADVDQILEKRRWLLQRRAGGAAREAGDSCGRLRTAAS